MTTLPTLTDMIATLVRTPSVSCVNPVYDMSNRPVAEQLANWLSDLGANAELMDIPGPRDNLNVIAQFGSGPPGIALCGHTDTVPCDESLWQYDPYQATQVDDRLYGLGSADMKGFLALAMHAVQRFQATDLQRSVIFIGSADEESSMDGARILSSDNLTMPNVCLVGEPTDMQPIRQHKGSLMERVTVIGRSGHSSDPKLGLNAIEGMQQVLRALDSFRTDLEQRYQDDAFNVPVPTLNYGHIIGGDNPNRICGDCSLDFDLRLMPGMHYALIRQALHQHVRNAMHESDFQVTFTTLFEGVDALQGKTHSPFVHACEQHSGHVAGAVSFCTEAPFYAALGADTVVMGPGSIDVAHQPNEFLPLNALAPMQSVVEKLIHQYCVDV